MDAKCMVCNELYDNGNRLPKVLRCGHTFCKVCLRLIVNNERASYCPVCKTKISYKSVDDITSNFALVTGIQKTKNAASCNTKDEPSSCTEHDDALKSYWCSTCKESVCDKCKTTTHCAPPSGQCIVLTEDVAVVNIKKDAVKENQKFRYCLRKFQECVIENKARIENTIIDLDIRKEDIDTDLIILKQSQVSLNDIEGKLNKWIMELSKSLSVLDKTEQLTFVVPAVENHNKQLGKATNWFDSTKSLSQMCLQSNLLRILPSMTGMYAIKTVNDKSMWAKITVENDKILLHSLEHHMPPFHAQIVQYFDVYKLEKEEKAISIALDVFHTDTCTNDRIIIKLHKDNCLSKAMLSAVAGEKNVSLKDSQIAVKEVPASNPLKQYYEINTRKYTYTSLLDIVNDIDQYACQLTTSTPNSIYATVPKKSKPYPKASPFKFNINKTNADLTEEKYCFGHVTHGVNSLSTLTSSSLAVIQDCSLIVPISNIFSY